MSDSLGFSELVQHLGHLLAVNAEGISEKVPGMGETVGLHINRIILHCENCKVDMVNIAAPDIERMSSPAGAGDPVELRRLVLAASIACTTPGCQHCKIIGRMLGQFDGRRVPEYGPALVDCYVHGLQSQDHNCGEDAPQLVVAATEPNSPVPKISRLCRFCGREIQDFEPTKRYGRGRVTHVVCPTDFSHNS